VNVISYEGVAKDEIKAFEYYKKSAENGYINAKFLLGYCYVNGIGTEVNKEKGLELYDEAVSKENSDAEILEKVNYWYHKVAENDDKYALYMLGELYSEEGMFQNETRAFVYYEKSADQGYVDAQYKLGYYYDHGIEVDINKEKAFDLYKIAAEKENIDAQRSLASLYEHGEGTEKNLDKAVYWYKKAKENGCLEAKESLNALLKQDET